MNHSKRNRAAIVITAGLSTTLLLAGCAASDGSGGNGSSEAGELRILANITPVLTKDYYENLVAPYVEAHPGVKVTIEVPSGDSVQTTLQQELASGSTPDIVASNLDATVVPQLVSFPEEPWVLDTPLAEENKLDGQIWQVATGEQIQSLVFYNKTAFEKAGITELPTSIDDFTASLKLLKDAGYVPLDTAGEWVTGAQFAMAANPLLLGDNPEWFHERNAGDVTFAGSAYETFLGDYQGWLNDGLVASDALGLKYQDSIDQFTSGESATYIMGNWIVPSIDEAQTGFEVGVFPIPTPDGTAPKQMSGAAQPYSILKNSKNQELAMDLVKYLVSDPAAIQTSLESEGNFRKGISYPASPLTEAVGQILDDSPGSVVGTSAPGVPAGFGDQLNTSVQKLYTNGGTPASIAAELDSWWDANATE